MPITVKDANGVNQTIATNDEVIQRVNLVGTRNYGTPVARLSYTGVNASSAAVAAAEVLLHNCGSGRCFVRAGSVATVDGIPLEPGEKFHLRITSGMTINAIQETTGGNLNIVPVV